MFWLYDYWYLLFMLPPLVISLWAQFRVKSTFHKYSQVGTRSGMTGADACRAIQQQNGLQVPIEGIAGSMTDHYDPRTNVIRLSETVGPSTSLAAIGVAAHETGHALQYQEQYFPIRLRAALVPITNFGSSISMWLILIGLIFSNTQMLWLAYVGVALFFLAVLFQLVTLPVEFNASARAMRALEGQGILTQEELKGAKAVLSAAAMTYVAALFTSLMQFLYLLLRVLGAGGRNRRG